jgi:putative transposase
MLCNNREFWLARLECRKVLRYAIKKLKEKNSLKLYAICIMSGCWVYAQSASGDRG